MENFKNDTPNAPSSEKDGISFSKVNAPVDNSSKSLTLNQSMDKKESKKNEGVEEEKVNSEDGSKEQIIETSNVEETTEVRSLVNEDDRFIEEDETPIEEKNHTELKDGFPKNTNENESTEDNMLSEEEEPIPNDIDLDILNDQLQKRLINQRRSRFVPEGALHHVNLKAVKKRSNKSLKRQTDALLTTPCIRKSIFHNKVLGGASILETTKNKRSDHPNEYFYPVERSQYISHHINYPSSSRTSFLSKCQEYFILNSTFYNRSSIEQDTHQNEPKDIRIKIQKRREKEEQKYESSYKDVGREIQFHINPASGLVEKPTLPHLAPSTSALTLNNAENAAKYTMALKTFYEFIDDEILNFDSQIRENLKKELRLHLENISAMKAQIDRESFDDARNQLANDISLDAFAFIEICIRACPYTMTDVDSIRQSNEKNMKNNNMHDSSLPSKQSTNSSGSLSSPSASYTRSQYSTNKSSFQEDHSSTTGHIVDIERVDPLLKVINSPPRRKSDIFGYLENYNEYEKKAILSQLQLQEDLRKEEETMSGYEKRVTGYGIVGAIRRQEKIKRDAENKRRKEEEKRKEEAEREKREKEKSKLQMLLSQVSSSAESFENEEDDISLGSQSFYSHSSLNSKVSKQSEDESKSTKKRKKYQLTSKEIEEREAYIKAIYDGLHNRELQQSLVALAVMPLAEDPYIKVSKTRVKNKQNFIIRTKQKQMTQSSANTLLLLANKNFADHTRLKREAEEKSRKEKAQNARDVKFLKKVDKLRFDEEKRHNKLVGIMNHREEINESLRNQETRHKQRVQKNRLKVHPEPHHLNEYTSSIIPQNKTLEEKRKGITKLSQFIRYKEEVKNYEDRVRTAKLQQYKKHKSKVPEDIARENHQKYLKSLMKNKNDNVNGNQISNNAPTHPKSCKEFGDGNFNGNGGYILPYLSSAWNIDGSHLYRLDLHPPSIYHNIPFHSTYFRNCPDVSNACMGRKGEKFFYKNNEADHWLNISYPDHYHLQGRLDTANITSMGKINGQGNKSMASSSNLNTANNYDQSEFCKESGGIGVGYYSHPSSSSSTCSLSRWTSLKSRSDIPINPLTPFLNQRADSSATFCDTVSSNAGNNKNSAIGESKILKIEDGECGIRYPYAMKTSSRIFRNEKNIHHQHNKNYQTRATFQSGVAFGRGVERNFNKEYPVKAKGRNNISLTNNIRNSTNCNYKDDKEKKVGATKKENKSVTNSTATPIATVC